MKEISYQKFLDEDENERLRIKIHLERFKKPAVTKKEKINRNIGLTFDFLRQAADNPDIINTIPDGSILEFFEKDFPAPELKTRT